MYVVIRRIGGRDCAETEKPREKRTRQNRFRNGGRATKPITWQHVHPLLRRQHRRTINAPAYFVFGVFVIKFARVVRVHTSRRAIIVERFKGTKRVRGRQTNGRHDDFICALGTSKRARFIRATYRNGYVTSSVRQNTRLLTS